MRLGDVLQEINISEDEKERISSEINRKNGIVYRAFNDNYTNTQNFEYICQRNIKIITGFRPNTELYKNRVKAKIIKSFFDNKAPGHYWNLYLSAVIPHIKSKLPALDQLLADTEMPDDIDITTSNILSLICKNAKSYSVNDRDLECLYQIWPFERVDNISFYLDKCPKFDRFRALEETINNLERRLEKFTDQSQNMITESIEDVKKELEKQNVQKLEYDKRIEELKNKSINNFEDIKKSINSINERFTRADEMRSLFEKNQSDKDVEFFEKSFKNFEAINTEIKGIKDNQSNFEQKTNENIRAVNKENFIQQANNILESSIFSVLQNDRDISGLTGITVKKSYEVFNNSIAKETEEPNSQIYFYSALLSNCLIVNDLDLFNFWKKATGWGYTSATVCASALWVDEHVLSEHIHWLFSEEETPKILTILNFDLGYTSGYLIPFLHALKNSDIKAPWKKIVLIPSDKKWKIKGGLEDYASVLSSFISSKKVTVELSKESSQYISVVNIKSFLNDDFLTSSDLQVQSKIKSSQIDILNGLPISQSAVLDYIKSIEAYWDNKIQ